MTSNTSDAIDARTYTNTEQFILDKHDMAIAHLSRDVSRLCVEAEQRHAREMATASLVPEWQWRYESLERQVRKLEKIITEKEIVFESCDEMYAEDWRET